MSLLVDIVQFFMFYIILSLFCDKLIDLFDNGIKAASELITIPIIVIAALLSGLM